MKILYSTMSVVEYDGTSFYNNPIKASYKRYMPLGDDMVVLCFKSYVKVAKQDKIEDGIMQFVFLNKINSIKALIGGKRRENEEIIKEEVRKADICVLHMPCFHNYQVIKYAKKYNKPYITVVCASAWDEYWTYDWRGKIIAPYAYYKLKKAQKESLYSIYVTEKYLQSKYPTSGKSIGCSNVNIQTGLEGVLDKRLCKIESLYQNKSVLKIGTVAPLDVPYKGQADVIKALSILKKEGFYFEYHLLGKGDKSSLYNIALKYDVLDQIIFHGAISHEKVFQYYDMVDIYIHPSRTEGLPRAVIEAMSRGNLCFGSNVGGIPELIDASCIFHKKSINEIARCLRTVNKKMFITQSRRNYQKATQYDIAVLNNRRRDFILDFKKSIDNKIYESINSEQRPR